MNKGVMPPTFGNKLMMLYGRANLSQGQFASLVGVSSVALRKWESGASCPKAESLKRVIEVLTSKGAFAQGEEQTEAMHLWALANQRGLKVPFDEGWFRTVIQGQAGAAIGDSSLGADRTGWGLPPSDPSPVPGVYPDLPTKYEREEHLTWPVASSDVGDAQRILPHPSRDFVFTPAKRRRRRQRPLAILIVLVVLSIIGATGAFFFYARDHTTDQAYPGYLSGQGTLVFLDPLSGEGGSQWASSSLNAYGEACQFLGGAYHVSLQKTNTPFQSCPTRGTFSNFAFEVQLTIVQGDCGGIVFRMEREHFYFFCVCEDGTGYAKKHVSDSSSDIQPLVPQHVYSAVHTGLGHQNKIAVVASGPTMTFYVNEQEIAWVQDSSYTLGNMALIARLFQSGGHATDVAFSNARLWKL